MKLSSSAKICGLFLGWRIGLFVIAFLATIFIPQFGFRFPYWDQELIPTGLPNWIWGFGNFDGVHYIRLAKFGYESSQYSQAFFPLYPKLIEVIAPQNLEFLTGLILSNLLFFLAVFVFYQLIKLDYGEKFSFKSLLLLLAFPTSFYFGSVYPESLLFFLSLLSLFFMRKRQFIYAGFFAALASATKIFGLILILPLLVEIYLFLKEKKLSLKSGEFIKAIFGIVIAPVGIISYIIYLKLYFNDPWYFLTSQSAFGAERSSQLVLLPQVLFRYIKVFMTVQVVSLPFFNALLEFIFTMIPLLILIIFYKKIRFSYWIFTLGCLIIPTLTGTLSSMPRYILMGFLLFPFIGEITGKYFNHVIFLLIVLQLLLLSLFIRGYWVA